MAGATSLVELILKKWGDDIAGAAKELEQKVGFPESVANRIASGELPMDPESQAMRRGLFEDAEGFHGSTHDIKKFDGSMTQVDNDFGQGTYITDDSYDASENYAGIGADLTNRLERHAEANWFQSDKFDGPDHVRTIGGEDFTKAQWEDLEYDQKMGYLRRDALSEIGGETRGVMYPVSVNHDGVVNSTDRIRDSIEMKDWNDYLTEAAEDLETSYQGETVQSLLDPDGEYFDEVHDLAAEMQYDDETNPTMIAYDAMRRYGLDEGPFELDHLDTWQDLRDVMDDKISNGWYPINDDGEILTSGAVMSEVMQELGLKGYNDMSSMSRFSGMDGGAGRHTIMFPGSENQIRSVNAAFDPEYKGSNIMGNATVPMLATTAGLSGAGLLAGSLAAPEVKDSGMISAPRSETLFDLTMGARDLERRLEGSPASLLFPSGLVEYLETVNRREEDPNAVTRGMALLDVIP